MAISKRNERSTVVLPKLKTIRTSSKVILLLKIEKNELSFFNESKNTKGFHSKLSKICHYGVATYRWILERLHNKAAHHLTVHS
jgi:hypothetical protein